MAPFKQLSFSDLELQENRKITRTEEKLRKIDQFVDFEPKASLREQDR